MAQISSNINELAGALVEFHKRIGSIKKDSNNPFFKSKYASLNTLLDNAIPILCEVGLTVVQVPEGTNSLTTYLIHAKSGQHIQSTYEMAGHKNTAQEQGSLLSYMRRYSLLATLNLNVSEGEDDDGNAATFGGNKKPSKEINNKSINNYSENSDTMWKEEYVNDMYNTQKEISDSIIKKQKEDNDKPWLNIGSKEFNGAVEKMKAGKSSIKALRDYFKISKKTEAALVEAAANDF